MVKIAHLISTSGLYGAERWLLALLPYLKTDSLLITPSTSNPELMKEAQKLDINTKQLQVKGNYSFFNFINQLKKLIKKENIDILHTHGYKADILGYFASKKTNTKIISTPHGWSRNAGLKLRFYEALDRHFLKKFDLVVPLSKALAKNVKNKNTQVIHNFVDLNTIPKPKKGNPKITTFVGQLIERKRVQDSIKAMKHLPQEYELQIIGDGPQKQKLTKLTKKLKLQERINFLGFRKDRLELLNESQIVVLPSLLEGIPRVLMEAMAMKRITIATDIPGTTELIQHKKNGLLVPTKKPKKIAQAILFINKNKKLAQNITKQAQKTIEKEFSAKKAAKKFDEIYQE